MHITAYLRNIMHISCIFPSFFCVSVRMLAYDCKCQSDSFQLLSPGARPVPSQPVTPCAPRHSAPCAPHHFCFFGKHFSVTASSINWLDSPTNWQYRYFANNLNSLQVGLVTCRTRASFKFNPFKLTFPIQNVKLGC